MVKRKSIIKFVLTGVALLAILFLSKNSELSVDLTEDKLYSLTQPSKDFLYEIEDEITIHILLNGELPAGLKRLRHHCANLVRRMNRINPNISYRFVDPNKGTVEEINANRKELADAGIRPMAIPDMDEKKYIYPYLIIVNGDRQLPVQLLEKQSIDFDVKFQINNSLALLEYKIIKAMEKVTSTGPPTIAFTSSHGEMSIEESSDMRRELSKYYRVGQLILDSLPAIPDLVDLVIVAGPTKPFSDDHKFLLDQYIMAGGRVIFLVDHFSVSLDSLQRSNSFVPNINPHGLDDMFFKYGARFKHSLVQDLECSSIPLAVGQAGGNKQFELLKWYYFPLAVPSDAHPMTKSLDRVFSRFASSIDTLKTENPVRKTVVLSSSPFARSQPMPGLVDLDITKYPPKPEEFKEPFLPIGVLLEGGFTSLFKNKPIGEVKARYQDAKYPVLDKAEDGVILILGDADIIRNDINIQNGQVYPVGFNRFEQKLYGNADFLSNAVEFMLDKRNLILARNKNLSLRLLNTVKAKNEKFKWQLINLGIPLIALALCGFIFQIARRRRYN